MGRRKKERSKILHLSKDDYEKLILSFLNVVIFLSIAYRYVMFFELSSEMVYLAGLLLGAFVARKGLSYWKPDRYADTTKPKIETFEEKDESDGSI